ncbi:MAG TPA: sugar phosphate isomerase/epimerase family protein [Tepidisphaeraceae bacterium]|nr:sugar phosphate isomerase/epimerase family protein [Tepidisphaeraceae bacterium]
MHVSISTICMPHSTWRQAFAEAAAAGYEAVELLMIPGWLHGEPDQIEPAALREEAARHQLRVVAVHGGGLDGGADAAMDRDLAYLDRLAAFAAGAGVPLVNFNGGPTPVGATDADRRAIAARIGRGLRTALPGLVRRGVRLTLENHFGYQLQDSHDYAALFAALGETPDVGVTIDTGHLTAAGVDAVGFVRRFARRVFHAHIKDHVGYQSVALGRGETDNAGVLASLRAADYRGHVSIEIEPRDPENLPRYVREGLPYVRSLLDGKPSPPPPSPPTPSPARWQTLASSAAGRIRRTTFTRPSPTRAVGLTQSAT